ncbi:hypothetical protein DNTS_027984 [Danionella cerebrum]|uniref:Transmembrane protein 70 n=1 Tax=Danionella cerebrum TaxID=2873325 RepID=A0A553RBT8_9TELE|nr:hypothetical protein DNTS_027984 [Danionella translucida]
MNQIVCLLRPRPLSKIQQQIIGNLQVVVCPAFYSSGNVYKSHAVTLPKQDQLIHVMRRSFLKALANKPYCSVRCFTSSSPQSEDGELIYKGNLGRLIRGVKLFSYSTSIFSLVSLPYLTWAHGFLTDGPLALQVIVHGFLGSVIFFTPALLHYVTNGYVLRLYHNKEKNMYTAFTLSFFLMEKRTLFHQSEVVIPSLTAMFTSFYVRNRSMFVNPMYFDIPHDYNHLMGYDHPFKFDLED